MKIIEKIKNYWKIIALIMAACMLFALNYLSFKKINNTISRPYSISKGEHYITYQDDIEYATEILVNSPREVCFKLRTLAVKPDSVDYKLSYNDDNEVISGKISGESIEQIDEDKYIVKINTEGLGLKGGTIVSFDLKVSNCSFELLQYYEGNAWNLEYSSLNYGIYYGIIVFIDIISIIMCIALFILGTNDRSYLIVFTCIGIVLAVLLPPCSQADEFRHMIRAYDLSFGHFATESKETIEGINGIAMKEVNGYYPYAIVSEDMNSLRTMGISDNEYGNGHYSEHSTSISAERLEYILSKSESDTTYLAAQTGTWSLSVFSYWPQVFGMLIGRVLGIRPLFWCYLARFFNAFVCVIIGWICLKLIPQYKYAIWALSFMPGLLILKSSNSTDGLVFHLCILLCSYIIYLRSKAVPWISWKRIAIILGLSIYISIMKLPYILLVFLIIILGAENYRNRNFAFIKSLGISSAIFAVTYVLYGRLTALFNSFAISKVPEIETVANNSVLTSTVSKLGNTIKPFIKYLISQIIPFFTEMKNAVNGRLFPFRWVFLVMLICTFILLKKNYDWRKRLLVTSLFAIIWIMIIFVFFAVNSDGVGYDWGRSDRYMLPILPLFMVILPSGNYNTARLAKFPLLGLFALVIAQIFYCFKYYWF